MENPDKRLKQRNKDILLGTWNVLSWYRPGIATRAVGQLEKYKMDITAIQEIRWIGTGSIQMQNSLVFWSGSENLHEFGCGFVVNKKYRSAIIAFKPVSNRMCILRVKGRWHNWTLFSVHAPTNEADEEKKDDFYEMLEQEYQIAPRNDIKIILGDLNAQLGKEDHLRHIVGRHSLHDVTNENGNRLADFAIAMNMSVRSTQFQRKNIHKITWVSNDGVTQNQIDHVLVDGRFSSNIEDVRSMRGADSDSDHFLVRSKLKEKLSTKKPNITEKRKKWDIDKFKRSQKVEEYEEAIKNRAQALQTEAIEKSIEEEWQEIKTIIREAATEAIGITTGGRRNRWYDQECENALDEKAKKRITFLENPTNENKETFNTARTNARKLLRRKKKEHLEERVRNMEENNTKNQAREFYREIRTGKNGQTMRELNFVEDDTGKLLTSDDDIIQRWRQYFLELLNKRADGNDQDAYPHTADLDLEPPTLEEVKRAISKLKNHKSPGEDEINAELLKMGSNELHKKIHHIIANIWKQERMPDEWNSSIIIPIHKKGKKTDCRNHRGISLVNSTYKIISSILVRRITPYAEEVLGDYQCGFRPGRSTIDQIFTVRQIMEKCWEFNRDIHQIFLDFQQAYDSINRNQLWCAMRDLGIPLKLIKLSRMCLGNSKAKVRVGHVSSESFKIHTGLRQGDPLSPLLFNLALDWAMKKISPQITPGFAVDGTKLMLAFADDIDAVAHNTRDVKEIFSSFETHAQGMGLEINEAKTKYMVTSRNPRQRIRQNVTINNHNFEVVKEFKYLGATITDDNKNEKDVAARVASANRTLYALSGYLRSKILTRGTKIKIYKTMIRPVLSYGSETWVLNKKEVDKLLVFERKILRIIFGPIRDIATGEWRRRNNRELEELYGMENIVRWIKSNRLRWTGHVARSDDQRLMNIIYYDRPEGRRSVGRPRKRWRDAVTEDLRKMGITHWEIEAQDRQGWRAIVDAAKTHPEL